MSALKGAEDNGTASSDLSSYKQQNQGAKYGEIWDRSQFFVWHNSCTGCPHTYKLFSVGICKLKTHPQIRAAGIPRRQAAGLPGGKCLHPLIPQVAVLVPADPPPPTAARRLLRPGVPRRARQLPATPLLGDHTTLTETPGAGQYGKVWWGGRWSTPFTLEMGGGSTSPPTTAFHRFWENGNFGWKFF